MACYLDALNRGTIAENARHHRKSARIAEQRALCHKYGRVGYVLWCIQTYTNLLNLGQALPEEVLMIVIEMALERGGHHYLLDGVVSASPFPTFGLKRFSPYRKKDGSPYHDLATCRYVIGMDAYQFVVQFRREEMNTRKLTWMHREMDNILEKRDVMLLELRLFDISPSLAQADTTICAFLKGVSEFDHFKMKLLHAHDPPNLEAGAWKYSALPTILDPTHDHYKLRQIWAVMSTVRAMIDLPHPLFVRDALYNLKHIRS